KEALEKEPVPLLSQAEGHRSRPRPQEVKAGAQTAVDRTAEAIEREGPPVLEGQLHEPDPADTPQELPAADLVSHRMIEIECEGVSWWIDLELSTDPAGRHWLYVAERA